MLVRGSYLFITYKHKHLSDAKVSQSAPAERPEVERLVT